MGSLKKLRRKKRRLLIETIQIQLKNTFATTDNIKKDHVEKIRNVEELKSAIKDKNNDKKYEMVLEEKYFNFKQINEVQFILQADQFLELLRHLFDEIDLKFVEFNDNFKDERRKFLQKDEKKYINCIRQNLQRKEEYFQSVLTNVMGKFSINQGILDKTIHYYFNLCESNNKMIKDLKLAYDNLFNAGTKYTIAPKSLTKTYLKKIFKHLIKLFDQYLKR